MTLLTVAAARLAFVLVSFADRVRPFVAIYELTFVTELSYYIYRLVIRFLVITRR